MAYTPIPIYGGVVPQRTQSPDEFSSNADDWLDYQAPLAESYNTLAGQVNDMANAAAESETNSAESESNAADSATAAADSAQQVADMMPIYSTETPIDTVGVDGQLYIQKPTNWMTEKTKQWYKNGSIWEQFAGNRNYVTFNGVSQYAVAPRVSEVDLDDPNLEFEIEWEGIVSSNANSGAVIALGDDNKELEIRFGGGANLNNLRVELGGVAQAAIISKEDAQSNSLWGVVYKAGIVYYKLNGVVFDTDTISIGAGRSANTTMVMGAQAELNSFYSGTLSSLRIWTNGDRNTGTLTRDYRFDEGWGANPDMYDTSGNSADGTYIGFTETDWSEVTL